MGLRGLTQVPPAHGGAAVSLWKGRECLWLRAWASLPPHRSHPAGRKRRAREEGLAGSLTCASLRGGRGRPRSHVRGQGGGKLGATARHTAAHRALCPGHRAASRPSRLPGARQGHRDPGGCRLRPGLLVAKGGTRGIGGPRALPHSSSPPAFTLTALAQGPICSQESPIWDSSLGATRGAQRAPGEQPGEPQQPLRSFPQEGREEGLLGCCPAGPAPQRPPTGSSGTSEV